MGLVFDAVSHAVDEFMLRRGQVVVDATLRKAFGLSERIETFGLEVRRLNRETLTLDRIHSSVIDICSRNSFGLLLLLFRKVRHEFIISLLQVRYRVSTQDVLPLVDQATIYATNVILQHARRDDVLAEYGARYRLQPNDEDMSDALRLAVYALVHRHLMFFANTQTRRPLGYEVSFEPLIDSYNARQRRRNSLMLVDVTDSDRSLVIPALVFNIPSGSRTIRVELAAGETRTIAHRNYFPLAVDFDTATASYDYLDTHVFTDLWHMQYPKWKMWWAALNRLLIESLISLWTPQFTLNVGVEKAASAAENADDYSDTGIGTATVESLIQGCMYVAEHRFGEHACTREDASLFIDGLTMKGPLDYVHFVEQPILFYDIGHGRVMWDFLRHTALVRAFARKTIAHQVKRKAGDNSGPGFEKYIAQRLRNVLPEIRDLKLSVLIRSGRDQVWDIDVGFVLNEVLFLIEAKHYQKSIRYHAADGAEVSYRVQSWESWCERLDMKLTQYREQVRHKWQGSSALGAICIVCTEDIEFVASADRKYWLNFPQTPRICSIDEFIGFLNSGGAMSVIDHPNFCRFVLGL